ncbi:hypothetical protein [Streptomyces boninensis]|uniref:hypothetical protein n=1 Tax=Streptomyces boninensis TaxID=2039455 RepID=UPI003B20EFA5
MSLLTNRTSRPQQTTAARSARSHRRRPRTGPPPDRDRPPRTGAVWTAFGLAATMAVLFAVSGGSFSRTAAFLDFGAGVLALVALTGATLWGLVAAERKLLIPDHRLVAQAVHRGLAVSGLGFLALHVGVKIAAGSVTTAQALLPFETLRRAPLIALGTVAGYLFLAVAVTGAVRGAFARKGGSRGWRGLHMGAYVAWGLALVHGLKAGRPAAGWVSAMYGLALAGAVVALAWRLAPSRNPPRAPGSGSGGPAKRRATR